MQVRDYSTVPMDAEGNDSVVAEPAAQAPGPERPRKRKKVRCHDMLVSVFEGGAGARGMGGWQYKYPALKLAYLTNAALGTDLTRRRGRDHRIGGGYGPLHGRGSNTLQRSRQTP